MSQVSDVGILNNNYYLYAQASTTVPKVGVATQKGGGGAKNIRGSRIVHEKKKIL